MTASNTPSDPRAFDVIVIGGGHAGTEAAGASARLGAKTLLITHQIEALGQMSCNPAIGGIGKGHLVKEIDALGGIMGCAIDAAGIHFRTLNASKGPAVRATRAQADRMLYKKAIRQRLEAHPTLYFFQDGVDSLILEKDQVKGVITRTDERFYAKSVVLTAGTFLAGKIHIGRFHLKGGRAGEAPSTKLAQQLRDLPFRVKRLKTGTPPRIDGRSIDFSRLEKQWGDQPLPRFSYHAASIETPPQVCCYITHTNVKTHAIIKAHLKDSPLFNGSIESVGPRYCPSIEDKVVRFADRDAHQLFLEPEGLSCKEFYPNGISTSLPFEAQLALTRSIVGLEHAYLTRPGYAIEYDFYDPRDLSPWLETKFIEGLFFAGQINGTTGYEEAGAQGLMAGLNAARKVQKKPYWYPTRDQAYIGVLIDDLITQGTLEPYRMFTSRAEYRLLLREDNADLRLTEKAYELGLVDATQYAHVVDKKDQLGKWRVRLQQTVVGQAHPKRTSLEAQLRQPLDKPYTLESLLRRPCVTWGMLPAWFKDDPEAASIDDALWKQLEIQVKYAGYIDRQTAEIKRMQTYQNKRLPPDMDYHAIKALSREAREKLTQHKPATVGHAMRIPGITQATITLLMISEKIVAK